MRKIITLISVICGILFAIFLLLLALSPWWFPEWWGSRPLGNNIYLIDWDNNSKIIVWGSGKIGDACYAGQLLIPNKKNSYSEKIISVETKARYIYVKTSIDNKNKYYIIDLKYDKENIDVKDLIKYHIKESPNNIWLKNQQDDKEKPTNHKEKVKIKNRNGNVIK